MSLRKPEIKTTIFDIDPNEPIKMHEEFPFFAFNLIIRPRIATGIGPDGKRTLVVMGMSDRIEPEDHFYFYTTVVGALSFDELDLYQIERVLFVDMVQEGFPEQYPDNRTGREDFTFGKIKLPNNLEFEVVVTFLDVEDPSRYPDSRITDAARLVTGRFDEMEDQEVAEQGRNLVNPVFEEEYEKRLKSYYSDIEEAWGIFK